jgi:CheY-like chemotaxis protein
MKEFRVLVVEDDPILAIVASKTLRKLNVPFDLAPSGERALDLVDKHQYDLILMDGRLPGISGCETARAIRVIENERNLARCTIVGVTASDNISECISAGMDSYARKPAAYADIVMSTLSLRCA